MVAARQRQLYREFQTLKDDHASATATLKSQLGDVTAARDAAELRAKELGSLVQTLSKASEEELKSALIDGQRKLMVSKVNEKALTRRYQALQQIGDGLRKENLTLKVY